MPRSIRNPLVALLAALGLLFGLNATHGAQPDSVRVTTASAVNASSTDMMSVGYASGMQAKSASMSYTKFKNAKSYPFAGGPINAVDPLRNYTRGCSSYADWRLSHNNNYKLVKPGAPAGWKALAKKKGYRVDHKPSEGAIGWWSRGHVAWMHYDARNGWEIHEYNWGDQYRYKKRVRILSKEKGSQRPEFYLHFPYNKK